jgi:hypothetical protein
MNTRAQRVPPHSGRPYAVNRELSFPAEYSRVWDAISLLQQEAECPEAKFQVSILPYYSYM